MGQKFRYDKALRALVPVEEVVEKLDIKTLDKPLRKSRRKHPIGTKIVLVFDERTGKLIEHVSRPAKKRAKWPCESTNAGVMPAQVDEARQALKTHGIRGVEYRDDGIAVWRDSQARKQHLKSLNLRDLSGYDR